MHKQWVVTVDGQRYAVEAMWSSFWGSGKVVVNGYVAKSWGAVAAMRWVNFDIGARTAEVRRADGTGGGSSVVNVELFIDGQHWTAFAA